MNLLISSFFFRLIEKMLPQSCTIAISKNKNNLIKNPCELMVTEGEIVSSVLLVKDRQYFDVDCEGEKSLVNSERDFCVTHCVRIFLLAVGKIPTILSLALMFMNINIKMCLFFIIMIFRLVLLLNVVGWRLCICVLAFWFWNLLLP